jgi:tetratricopeptide (TPR) repeat protein
MRVESTCTLALARARQFKRVLAEKGSRECTALAEDTHKEQTKTYAAAFTTLIEAQFGNFAAARPAFEKLATDSPNDPELLVNVAISLASTKQYDDADRQLSLAISKFLAAGDKRSAANAYIRPLSVLGSDSSRSSMALQLKYLTSALRLYSDLGASADEARTSLALGDYFLTDSRTDDAIVYFNEAQKLAKEANHEGVLAQSLLGLGNAFQRNKNFAKAEELHLRAEELFVRLGNALGETICQRALSNDYYGLGLVDKRLATLLRARKSSVTAGPLQSYFTAYALGDFYRSQGEYEKALASFEDAARLTNASEDAEHFGYSHLALGEVDGLVGRWDDCLAEIHRALDSFVAINDKKGQAASWSELTSVYSDRTSPIKNFDMAQECYQKALALGADKSIEVDLLEIYIATGKSAEAARIAQQSVQDCSKKNDTFCEAHALVSLSEAERMSGDVKTSRRTMNDAKKLAASWPDFYLHGRIAYQESRLLVSEGRLSDALASYKKLISMIENIKGRLSAREQQSLSENYGFIYDELISLLYDMSQKGPSDRVQFVSEALGFAEKNKARQFAETWGRAFKSQMVSTLPPTVREQETSLDAQRERLFSQLDASGNCAEFLRSTRRSPTPKMSGCRSCSSEAPKRLWNSRLRPTGRLFGSYGGQRAKTSNWFRSTALPSRVSGCWNT